MSQTTKQAVILTILDKEYRILCRPEEGDSLKMAALFLDKKMRDIRNTGKVIGLERIAVMAALNITHDLLKNNHEQEAYKQSIRDGLLKITQKVTDALETHPI